LVGGRARALEVARQIGDTQTGALARQQAIAAWSALQRGQPVDDIYQQVGHGQTAYDATLVDLARTHNGMLARVTGEVSSTVPHRGISRMPAGLVWRCSSI
jgi:hypothetical protein